MIGRRLLLLTAGRSCSIAAPPNAVRIPHSRRLLSTSPRLRDEAKDEIAEPKYKSPPSKLEQPQQPVSSCPEGTVLKGINYIKKLNDPVALADDQYPDWLWTVIDYRRPRLDDAAGGLSAQDQAALYGKSKKKRQAALKKMAAMQEEGFTISVTPDHQTVDMPFEDPFKAQEHRELARKYAKARRRDAIKERNFLDVL